MKHYPVTLDEFEKQFTSEEACLNFIFKVRWPNGFLCPSCNYEKHWVTSRKLYHCARCGHETSITAGTIFEGTRQPLCLWLRFIWCVISQRKGISALELQRTLRLRRYETTWIMLHKLRIAMLYPAHEMLSGNVIVDETFLGSKKLEQHNHNTIHRTLVLIAVENEENHLGHIRLHQAPNASSKYLIPFIENNIEWDSTIVSDHKYIQKKLTSKGYNHNVVGQPVSIGENLLLKADKVAIQLKRWIREIYQGGIHASHLEYYLDEFTFRYNHI